MSRGDWKGLFILIGVGAVVIVLVSTRFLLQQTQYIIDETTLCPIDAPLHAHTVILVDRTDPLSREQSRALRRVIESAGESMEQYGKLSILAITNNVGKNLQRVFSLCSPGSEFQANPLYQNPGLVRRTYKERFGGPLAEVLESFETASSSSESPIVETLYELSTEYDFGPSISTRTLVIISDMLQNTGPYSHYKDHPYAVEREEKVYLERHRPTLENVAVNVRLLMRRGQSRLQTREQREFWHDFFDGAGATTVEFIVER